MTSKGRITAAPLEGNMIPPILKVASIGTMWVALDGIVRLRRYDG